MSIEVLTENVELTIPPEICAAVGLKPGDSVQLRVCDGALELRPVPTLRGCVRGINTQIDGEPDRF